MAIAPSELILNSKGHVYHLDLHPDMITPVCITVGDPDRVSMVSRYFDQIEVIRTHREFITHIGRLGARNLMVISTGIGTDNIDIVLNEIDALLNIDLETHLPKKHTTSIRFIRIGTSGSFHPGIPVDSLVVNPMAFGIDSLMKFYPGNKVSPDAGWLRALEPDAKELFTDAYMGWANEDLEKYVGAGMHRGIAISCPGFYGPQGRNLRLQSHISAQLLDQLATLSYENLPFTNFEMETAGLYSLSKALGHEALSVNTILANRINGQFSKDPEKSVDGLIRKVLEKISKQE
jgi:uridine phosphorylase